MDLMMRRRALMSMKAGETVVYAVSSAEAPNIMAILYAAGLCASADHMTVEEAAAVTQNQFDALSFSTCDGDDFSGFKYFTGVSSIRNSHFRRVNISTITLPNTLITIKSQAFDQCSIQSINNTEVVTTFGTYAFNQCSGITDMVIGDSTASIDVCVFRACDNLKTIIIGSGITTINTLAFTSCVKLETIVCKATTPPTLASNAFNDASQTLIVYVPDASVSAYQADSKWGNYTIKGLSEYVE